MHTLTIEARLALLTRLLLDLMDEAHSSMTVYAVAVSELFTTLPVTKAAIDFNFNILCCSIPLEVV